MLIARGGFPEGKSRDREHPSLYELDSEWREGGRNPTFRPTMGKTLHVQWCAR
jgi:hypothetical protein